jgi:hypothetical protein
MLWWYKWLSKRGYPVVEMYDNVKNRRFLRVCEDFSGELYGFTYVKVYRNTGYLYEDGKWRCWGEEGRRGSWRKWPVVIEDISNTLELNRRAKKPWPPLSDTSRAPPVAPETISRDIVMVVLGVLGAITLSVALIAGLLWALTPLFPK